MNKTERYHLIASIVKKLAREKQRNEFMLSQAIYASDADYVNVQAEKSQPDALDFN